MFKLVRVWVSKNPSQMCGNKKGYGITFKLQRVHIFDTMKKEEEIDDSAWFKEFKKPEKKDKIATEEQEIENEEEKEDQEEKQDEQVEKKEEEPEIQEEYVSVIEFAENENKPNEKKEDKKKKKTKKDHKEL